MTCAAIVGLLAACGGDSSPAGDPDAGGMPVTVGVETVAPEGLRAGQTLLVTCLLVDAEGEMHTPPAELTETQRIVPEGSVHRAPDGAVIVTRAGTIEVACGFPSLGLADETPALVEILPGAPASTVAHLSDPSVTAGDEVGTTCEVFDAYGNPNDDAEVTWRSEPTAEGTSFGGSTAMLERAGRYDVFCDASGADATGAPLEVLPGLPAALVIARVPDQPVYAIGQVIDIERIVTDRFGNIVPDAVVPVASDPAGEGLGDGRFRYAADGRYVLTATVAPPTEGDVELTESVEVVVDGSGPTIRCDSPADGAILDVTPGGTITFTGSVDDLTGVTEVVVNGATVSATTDGSFTAELTTDYGINFVDVAATDGTGREASRTCAFLVADVWAPDDRTLSDTLSLRLRQAAFDDSNRSDGLDSMADVFHTVLNSTGLRNELHASLLAANPLKPSSCDESVLGVCVLRSEVIYLGSQINGPNAVSLTLVDGGLRATVRVEDLRIRVRVRGQVAGINYDTTGWVTYSHVTVTATFDTRLSGGRPRVTVRPGSVSVAVGSISTNFSGLDGAVIDIVVGLFNGTIRNLVAGVVRDWVTDNLNDILDGVLGGLDIESLGTSFEVPRLDGSGSIPLSFGIGFSSLGTTTSRMLFGIGTRLYTPPAHARPTLGAPVRPGARLLDTSGPDAAGVAVHEAVLTQAVHALWRGGFFDATLDDATVGGLPDGLEATLTTGLPPVVVARSDGRVELSLGAMTMVLTYPSLFAEPVTITLGARASMAVALSGDELVFFDALLEELYFGTDLASLDTETRDTLEGLLVRVLSYVVSSALDEALPAVPIPAFELPSSLAAYGLPAGDSLGIVSPAFSIETPHLVLRGAFGVR